MSKQIAIKLSPVPLPSSHIHENCVYIKKCGYPNVYAYYRFEDIKKRRDEVMEELERYEYKLDVTCEYCGKINCGCGANR